MISPVVVNFVTLTLKAPQGRTDEGVAVGMEPKERANIRSAGTKSAMAVALAIERQYDIEAVYAVDGSDDATETDGAGATAETATAWGS